jgi:LysM repeat protein
MGRIWVRLVAGATVALCAAACVTGVASAAAANGARTISDAPSIKLNTAIHGRLYDSAFYSGFSVAFWTASLAKGDRLTIRTDASGGDTPPCQILFMPGTDDINVGSTSPVLNPVSQTRHGTHDGQRFEPATQTGTYILAMSNNDIFLTGPHQCLTAPADRPFTFTVTVAHRGSAKKVPVKSAGQGDGSARKPSSSRTSTHVVAPGQSLWVIAQGLVAKPADIAQVALKVDRLWQLNAARIGSGDPDLIFPGQTIRLT